MAETNQSQANAAEFEDLAAITDPEVLLGLLESVRPPDVSSWPAPGWWLLSAVLLVFAALFLRHQRRQRLRYRNAWRREAVFQILALETKLADASGSQLQSVLQDSTALLRRVMMHIYGRQAVAGLLGQSWLDFLAQQGPTRKLDDGLRALLTDAAYEPDAGPLVTRKNLQRLLSWMTHYLDELPDPDDQVRQRPRATSTSVAM